jgi:peptidoglycan/xylan/chitin deacetylase (PgdA/CDA1 family)
MIRLYRPFFVAKYIYRRALFRFRTKEKALCITFDDGPSPGSTEKIIEILGKTGTRAVFFCTGSQALSNPLLMERIRGAGHLTGNHGYHHISGFSATLDEYTENCLSASELTSEKIFRPPYGRMTISQYRKLSQRFMIVMWDLMAYDFDKGLSPGRVLSALKRRIRPGSVIVLHDKPDSLCLAFLEEFIIHCREEGYRFVFPSGYPES